MGQRVDLLSIEHYESIPRVENMKHGILYVSLKYGTAIHLCCCGSCGQQTVTPFKPMWVEGWDFKDADGVPTLYPSIGNFNFPCKTHYFITDGKVVWC